MPENKYPVSWPGWEVVDKIGTGGFGIVYKIRRDVYGDVEEAALKVITIPRNEDEVDYLRYNGFSDANITQTFHQQVGDIAREYNLMKRMRDNPNIVRCDDFRDIQHDNGLGWDIYIKMELLTPLLKASDRVKEADQIIHLGMDICNALVDCHEKGIIHRDIKPQNVFVASNGSFKLGDFGIARTIERTTRATAGIGTYSYMAPEVESNKPYGKTADIYSLGIMMYWLLNERRQPFMPLPPVVPKHGDELEARYRRFSGEPIPAPLHGSDELKRIVLKACAFDPKARFQSAQEMLDALKHCCGSAASAVSEVNRVVEEDRSEESDEEATVGVRVGKNIEIQANHNDTQQDEDATVGPASTRLDADATISPAQNRQNQQTSHQTSLAETVLQNQEAGAPKTMRSSAKILICIIVAILVTACIFFAMSSHDSKMPNHTSNGVSNSNHNVDQSNTSKEVQLHIHEISGDEKFWKDVTYWQESKDGKTYIYIRVSVDVQHFFSEYPGTYWGTIYAGAVDETYVLDYEYEAHDDAGWELYTICIDNTVPEGQYVWRADEFGSEIGHIFSSLEIGFSVVASK